MKSEGYQFHSASVGKIADMVELAELGRRARMIFHDMANHITALTLSISHIEENITKDTERLFQYSKKSEQARIQMEYLGKVLREHIESHQKTVFEPMAVIKEVARSFEPKTELLNIKIFIQPDSKGKVFGNKNAFVHVASNLIANAIQALEKPFEKTKKASGSKQYPRINPQRNPPKSRSQRMHAKEIRITAQEVKSDICLLFSDTGPGIPAKNISRIFDQNFTTRKEGHGLGLFAVKNFVENDLNGTIGVQSQPGKTIFKVSLPKFELSSPLTQNGKRKAFPILSFENPKKIPDLINEPSL